VHDKQAMEKNAFDVTDKIFADEEPNFSVSYWQQSGLVTFK
jgi:hypothetical protein